MNRMLRPFLALLLIAAAASPLAAQGSPSEPLERFITQVARLWASGDAGALVDLAPADSRIMLDVGENLGAVQPRHAAAALRALFAERQTSHIRTTGVTIAGGRPPRGFGELSWTTRSRGMSDTQTVTLYVGCVLEDGGWRIRELRILR
jgi:hypothetical protein